MFDRVADRARRRHRRRLVGAAVVAVGVVAAGSLALRPGGGDTTSATVATASCPGQDPGRPANPDRPDLADRLVPGRPVIATLCRYHRPDESAPSGTLARSVVIRDADVTALAATLNSGQPMLKDAVYSCPGFSRGSMIAIFEYRAGAAVTVSISFSDCELASNGPVTVFTPQLALQRLTDLVGKDPD
ncbi:hypothetical protein [Dactylosporangium cerinum]